ncbi:MAG: Zinc protease, partial [uncultured Gemmatimonadetes bacterium]
ATTLYRRGRPDRGRGGGGPAGRRADPADHRPGAHRVRAVPASQRAQRDPVAGPLHPRGGGERVVPRGIGQRGGGAHRVRPPLRAHDVPGLGEHRRRRALQDGAGGGRHAERIHQRGPHQLLRGGARQLPGTRPLAGGGPHGLPAPRHDPAEAGQPAQRGAERAAAELREPAVRPGAGNHSRGPVPGGAPLLVDHHRQPQGPERGRHGGRAGLLPHVLHAAQRIAGRRRRLRPGAGQAVDREVLRRHPRRVRDHPAATRPRDAHRGEAHRAGRPRAASAALPGVAHARPLRPGRRGDGHAGQRPGGEQELAALPAAGVPRPDRQRRLRRAGAALSGRAVHPHRAGQAGGGAEPHRPRGGRGDRPAQGHAPHRARAGAGAHHAGKRARPGLRVGAGPGRRAQPVLHLLRQPGVRGRPPRALPRRDPGGGAGRGAAVPHRRPRGAERGAAGPDATPGGGGGTM